VVKLGPMGVHIHEKNKKKRIYIPVIIPTPYNIRLMHVGKKGCFPADSFLYCTKVKRLSMKFTKIFCIEKYTHRREYFVYFWINLLI